LGHFAMSPLSVTHSHKFPLTIKKIHFNKKY
jgi:hypothetical protein